MKNRLQSIHDAIKTNLRVLKVEGNVVTISVDKKWSKNVFASCKLPKARMFTRGKWKAVPQDELIDMICKSLNRHAPPPPQATMNPEPYICLFGECRGEIHWLHQVTADDGSWQPYADFERQKLFELRSQMNHVGLSGRYCYFLMSKNKSKTYWSSDTISYSGFDYNKDSESNRLLQRALFLKAVCNREGVEWLHQERNRKCYRCPCWESCCCDCHKAVDTPIKCLLAGHCVQHQCKEAELARWEKQHDVAGCAGDSTVEDCPKGCDCPCKCHGPATGGYILPLGLSDTERKRLISAIEDAIRHHYKKRQ